VCFTWKKRRPLIQYREDDDILTKLACVRGIENPDVFFNPSRDLMHDPCLLNGIELAANKIIKAMMQRKKIGISVDPDCDGICSTAIMVRYLRNFTDNYYILYHQRSNGHGIENQLDQIQDGTELLIILDSSSNSVEACKAIKEREIDIVILDHHAIERENPYAVIVNPQLSPEYPNKEISGAGVVYKTLQVIDDTLMAEVQADDFVDLVMVGMIGDMMDLRNLETRAIVKLGLENIKNPGLQALAKIRNKNPYEMNSTDVSFLIAPLINGTARLDKIEHCLALLLTDEIEKCLEIAKQMDQMRREKQEREMELFEKYKAKVNPSDKIIIVTDPQASKNFNGLIAQQLARAFQRPAIVLREHNGRLDGSFRSYGDFNLKSYLSKIKIINYVGGHEKAGGVGLWASKLETLRRIINQDLANVSFSTGIEFDLVLKPEEINLDLIKQVQKFDYLTGQGFEKAKFLIRGISIDDIQYLGGGTTCKITGGNLELIKFRIDEDWGNDLISFMFGDNVMIDALGSLNLNIWGNRKTMQVVLDEYRKMAG